MPKSSWVLIDTPHVGIIANMSAQLLTKFKDITPEGHIIELVVWSVPNPVKPSGSKNGPTGPCNSSTERLCSKVVSAGLQVIACK